MFRETEQPWQRNMLGVSHGDNSHGEGCGRTQKTCSWFWDHRFWKHMENITAVLVPGVVLPLAAGCVGKEECATSRRRDGCSHSQVPSPSEIPPVPKHTENMDQDWSNWEIQQNCLLTLIHWTKLYFLFPCANRFCCEMVQLRCSNASTEIQVHKSRKSLPWTVLMPAHRFFQLDFELRKFWFVC